LHNVKYYGSIVYEIIHMADIQEIRARCFDDI
jgi:hypothetical protein